MVNIALAGNPNSGKTTVFNYLTGSHERIGNWMGVTIESKSEKLRKKLNPLSKTINIIDLPGTYTMDGYTKDEQVSIDFIKSHQVDAIINIIDVSQLERSLVFTLELLHTKKPMIIALNKQDVAKKHRIQVDIDALESMLNAKIVCMQASRKKGIKEALHLLLTELGESLNESE